MNKCSCGFRIGHPEFSKCICKITKPLSDDEIMEIVADKYGKGHGRYIDTKLFFVEFAKAIEERHGIK